MGDHVTVIVRDEAAADVEAIGRITEAAFATLAVSQHTEQFIIAALRAAGALEVSLVAEVQGGVVGHLALSRVTLTGSEKEWYGLGPIAVDPPVQRQGVGKALLDEGLKRLRARDAAGCVLVGDPEYYKRFGFKSFPELCHEGVPQEYVLALPFGSELPSGNAVFHRAFQARE